MYGTLLSVFKVLSDALTALSGVFGLLSEFKDPATKRVTTAGKAALVGIIVGFILSGAVSLLEHEQSVDDERKHEAEITRLLHPANHMTASVMVPVPKDLGTKFPYLKKIKIAFRSAAQNPTERHGNDYDGINIVRHNGQLLEVLAFQDHMRRKFGDAPTSLFVGTTPVLSIYKNFDCDHLAQTQSPQPDWYLWSAPHSPEPNSDDAIAWNYKIDDSLTLQRMLDIKIQQSSGAITSVADLPGSSLFILWTSQYPFEFLTFSPAEGVSFNVNPENSKSMTIEIKVGQLSIGSSPGYCYNFPQSASGG